MQLSAHRLLSWLGAPFPYLLSISCELLTGLHPTPPCHAAPYPAANLCSQVQPDELFMSASEFRSKFLEPITDGQKHDASRWQRTKMARQLSVLQDRTAVRGSSWMLTRVCCSGCSS